MSDEKDELRHPARSNESERDVRVHPETNFLPPLKMILSFLDQDEKEKDAKQEAADERNVEKLIEKLSEKEEE